MFPIGRRIKMEGISGSRANPENTMSATKPDKKRKRELESESQENVRAWLLAFERSNKLENTVTRENDIGTIGFMVKGKSYTIPFTGLLKMANALNEGDGKKYNDIKRSIEKNFEPLHDICKNLIILAKFMKNGAALMRESGLEKISDGDSEMRSGDADASDGGANSDGM